MSDVEIRSDVAIRNVSSDLHIAACFAVMCELRPQLADADELVRRVRVQAAQGYVLAGAFLGDACAGCVGYRLADNLVHGRHLYVDDLVVAEAHRRARIGERLLAHACDVARAAGCAKLLLDTPTANVLGHRFYYRAGLAFTAMRFSLALGALEM